MALRYLFIDFDSFYASVEQELNPQLRGKPVAIVPTLHAETTSCIAASYEAKYFGVKTGILYGKHAHSVPKSLFRQITTSMSLYISA